MSPRINPHRRLRSETIDLRLPIGERHHDVKLSLCFDECSGALRELVFVGRGKTGQGLDQMLIELGIQISRAIQGRDPATGEKVR